MKKPRFYCDNCSREVGGSAESCPGCGRLFSSIRCPVCSLTGGEADFAAGCPACGYSATPKPAVKPAAKPVREGGGPLPFWALFLAVALFVLVFALLFLALP